MAEIFEGLRFASDNVILKLLPYRVVTKTRVHKTMLDWLKDESRPGKFTWQAPIYSPCAVYFSDPDVAFECKMRWG